MVYQLIGIMKDELSEDLRFLLKLKSRNEWIDSSLSVRVEEHRSSFPQKKTSHLIEISMREFPTSYSLLSLLPGIKDTRSMEEDKEARGI